MRKPAREQRPSSEPRACTSADGTPYGLAALEAECRAVREAPDGDRNNRLNAAAYAVGQLVAGGELAEGYAVAELARAAADAGLVEYEAGRTIRSGLEAGKREPRSAPPREEKPRRPEPEPPDDDAPPPDDADAPDEQGDAARGPKKPAPAELGRAFLAGHHMIAARGHLLVYRNGCYRSDGEGALRTWVQARLGSAARKHDGDETSYWLTVECAVAEDELDGPDVINVANGLLDWRKGTVQPHSPSVFSTVQLPVKWAPDAYHARVDRFLDEVLPDRETRSVVEEFVGYCLMPHCLYQRALMLTGEGSNGKSVLLSLIEDMLGPENVASVKLQDLEHRFRGAALVNKLANISADLPRAAVEDSGEFKKLVTGDRVQIEKKFRNPFEFTNRAKLIFSANELPGTRDRSQAFFRRWIVVPFPRRFPTDDTLLGKLVTDEGRSYLLRCAVDGARRLAERGTFIDTAATSAARDEYQRDADSIVAWYQDECSFEPESWTAKAEGYRAYCSWCERNGVPATAGNIVAKRLVAIEPRLRSSRPGGKNRQTAWAGLQVARQP